MHQSHLNFRSCYTTYIHDTSVILVPKDETESHWVPYVVKQSIDHILCRCDQILFASQHFRLPFKIRESLKFSSFPISFKSVIESEISSTWRPEYAPFNGEVDFKRVWNTTKFRSYIRIYMNVFILEDKIQWSLSKPHLHSMGDHILHLVKRFGALIHMCSCMVRQMCTKGPKPKEHLFDFKKKIFFSYSILQIQRIHTKSFKFDIE